MLEIALKFINEIEKHGFKAYIIGGFVRDYLLNIKSNDIDITTNAKPSDIKNIFKDSCLPATDYGSVTVYIKNIRFEVTTYRKEIKYLNNRKPVEFIYIDDLLDDLKRRDFTINTICMDKNKNIIDLLDGKKDLSNMVIKSVLDPYKKLNEDSLRILRAVRFATTLNFKLDNSLKDAIIKNKYLLKNLSYERKKEELDKILSSIHVKYGIKLLKELELVDVLELNNLDKINAEIDLIGKWAIIDSKNYRFTQNEKELIKNIQDALNYDNLDNYVLYKYGLYVNLVCATIKNIDKKIINYKYENLPIKNIKDINIKAIDIMKILDRKPGKYIKDYMKDIEVNILSNKLENNYESIKNYIINIDK